LKPGQAGAETKERTVATVLRRLGLTSRGHSTLTLGKVSLFGIQSRLLSDSDFRSQMSPHGPFSWNSQKDLDADPVSAGLERWSGYGGKTLSQRCRGFYEEKLTDIGGVIIPALHMVIQ
jgi:hypothetical protein